MSYFLTDNVIYANARLIAGRTSGGSAASGTTVIFNDVVEDTAGSYDDTTGEWTCPTDGTYTISVNLRMDGITAVSNFGFELRKDNVLIKQHFQPCDSVGRSSTGCTTNLKLVKNEVIKVVLNYGGAATASYTGSDVYNHISINRVADYTAGQPIGFGTSTNNTYGLVKGGGVPSGAIMPFAANSVPDGWLACDGADVFEADYPELFAVISSTWNTATNQLTGAAHSAPVAGKFRVPDLRGAFLRGVISGSTLHPDTVTFAATALQKTRKNGLTASAASSSVTGIITTNTRANFGSGIGTTNAFNCQRASVDNGSATVTLDGNISGTAAAQTITIANGDSETRPNNVGVIYIIKT